MDSALLKLTDDLGIYFQGLTDDHLYHKYDVLDPEDYGEKSEEDNATASKLYPFRFSEPSLGLKHEAIVIADVLHDHPIPSRGSTLTISKYNADNLFELEMPRGYHHRTHDPKDGRGWYTVILSDLDMIKRVKVWWMNEEGGMLIVRMYKDDPVDVWRIASHYTTVRYLKPVSTPLNDEHFLIFTDRLPMSRVPRDNEIVPQSFIHWLSAGRELMHLYNYVMEEFHGDIFHTQLALASWVKHLKYPD